MVIEVHKKCLLLVISVVSSLLHNCYAETPCPQNMVNSVVDKGSSAVFPNLFPNDPVQWQVGSSNRDFLSIKDITEFDNTVQPPFNGTYDVSTSQLTILNATTTVQGDSDPTAGLYLAKYQNTQCTAAAGLTVVDIPPTCSVDTSNSVNSLLTCSITFANYVQQLIVPIMNWLDSNGTVVKTEQPVADPLFKDNLGLRISTSNFPVPIGDSNSYTCVVTFSKPDKDQEPIVATNAPDYTRNCSVFGPTTTTVTTTSIASTSSTTMAATSTTMKTTTPTTVAPTSATSTAISTTTLAVNTATVQDCNGDKLKNIVAYRGNSSSFPRVVNGQPVQWQVGPSNAPFDSVKDITKNDDIITADFTGVYAVDQSQLIINDSTLVPQGNMSFSTAGLYVLNYLNREDCITGASLTVVDNPPVCIPDASDPNKLTCSITFANYAQQLIVPIMTWTDSRGNFLNEDRPLPNSLDPSNLGVRTSTSMLTVAPGDTSQYFCRVNFSTPDPDLPDEAYFVAKNAPDYNASCSTMSKVSTTTVATSTAVTTTTAAPATGTLTVSIAATSIQVTTSSSNPPTTNTADTSSNTANTTAQLKTGTVGPPASPTTENTTLPPSFTVPPSGSTASLFSSSVSSEATGFMSSSSGSAVSLSSSSGSTSPVAPQPSTGPNEQSTVTNLLPTNVSQQPAVSSSSASVSLSSETTFKAPSLTTAAISNSPRLDIVTDDPQAQATSIVLGLVLGSLVTTGLVSAFWCYCCFFPIGAKGAKRKQRILLVRRKFLFWRNEPPVEDIYSRSYPPVGRTFQRREPVAPENPWRYPALRKTFHWREPNENGNFWRWDPAANDAYSRRDFNAIET